MTSSTTHYQTPISPRDGEHIRFWRDSPAHTGRYLHAVDIIIPDPEIQPLPVFAPQSGIVIDLIQNHRIWGPNPEYLHFLNYITVEVIPEFEFYQLCHIGFNSCVKKDGSLIQIGDTISQGQIIAATGANGFMTDKRHLHFMTGRWTNKLREDFHSIPINWIPGTLESPINYDQTLNR